MNDLKVIKLLIKLLTECPEIIKLGDDLSKNYHEFCNGII